MILVSKDGSRITGSKERVYGAANILDFEEDGEPNYAGETDVDWDSQETVMCDGEPIYYDDDGDEYLRSECRLLSEEQYEEEFGPDSED